MDGGDVQPPTTQPQPPPQPQPPVAASQQPPPPVTAPKRGRPPTKKNAAKGDAAPPKKPSPKAPKTPKVPKAPKAADSDAKKRLTAAEKKKAAAAATAMSAASATSAKPTADASAEPARAPPTAELHPAQDSELRRASLHQIYQEAVVARQGEDDLLIRQFATNLEMEVCRQAASRSEYISAINYELAKLMQADMASKGDSSNAQAPGAGAGATDASYSGYQGAATSEQLTSSSDPKTSSSSATRQTYLAAHAQAETSSGQRAASKAPGGAAGAQMSEGSFMQTLMSEQSPSASSYSQGGRGQQPAGSAYSSAVSSAMHQTSSHGYDPSAAHVQAQQTPTSASMQMQQQQAYQFQQQQQHQHLLQQQQQQQQQQQSRPAASVTTFQEFAVQVQRFDRNALVEMLWNQRNTLLQWQRRVSQLEAQLSMATSRYSFGSSGTLSPYYSGASSGAPPSYGANVPSSLGNEAELARAAMRRNDRIGVQQQHQQQQYVHQQQQQQQQQQHSPYAVGGSPMTSGSPSGQAGGVVNPGLYWEKVRSLKEAHAQNLYIAHRALSQHTAPPSSAQGIKAENVKHNISLAMNVLSEPPKSIQPRPFEVLHSIERFIQNTVIPIVHKVQQSGGQTPQQQPSPAGGGPSGYPSSNATSSPSVSTSYNPTESTDAASSAAGGGSYVPSPSSASASQAPAGGYYGTSSPAASASAEGRALAAPSGSAAAASASSNTGKGAPSSSSARGKKIKCEAPKMPPRAKQPSLEAKAAAKRLSKVGETKLAAANQQQQMQQGGYPALQQQMTQQPQQATATVVRVTAVAADGAVADGHQSPFGTGASSFEKLSTPTVSPSENRATASAEDSVKSMALDAANKSSSSAAAEGDSGNDGDDDDALNDFADFPELDFDEEMSSMKIQFNKENSAFNAKKRSIGDV